MIHLVHFRVFIERLMFSDNQNIFQYLYRILFLTKVASWYFANNRSLVRLFAVTMNFEVFL